jgi:putative transcriptional regulator
MKKEKQATHIINRFRILLAERELKQGRSISLRQVACETQLSQYTVNGFANNSLKSIPLDALESICRYFGCQPGDLLIFQDMDGTSPAGSEKPALNERSIPQERG